MSYVRVTPTLIERIRALAAEGRTVIQIAAALGISESSVRRQAAMRNIKIAQRGAA